MDKLRAMTAFVAIADRGSLTAAADVLGTSLPSVVRTLAALERELGARLFTRTTRRIALTEEGRDYLDRARRVLAQVEDAEAALSARHVIPQGRIVLTSSVMFGRLHVAPLLAEFLGAHPRVKAELLLLDRVANLLEEGMDLGVRIGHLADSSLVAIPVGETRRVICASPDYLRRAGMPAAPKDLAAHACIRFTGLAAGGEWEFREAGKPKRVGVDGPLVTNQVDAALDATTSGLGCGMFLCYQVRSALAQGTLRLLLANHEPPPLPIHVVYPQGRHMPSRVRALVDWLVPRLRQRLAPHTQSGTRGKRPAAIRSGRGRRRPA
ncbi:MAG TPA: LysR family transcriptional regulator [Burkholderiales bacterium]|nr:LysR family transcriptional regulator [Burkholderiales bacterium]